jgi:hypothetical protein
MYVSLKVVSQKCLSYRKDVRMKSALDKLVKDCNAMDITNQIYTFSEAFLPARAAVELRDLLRIKLAAVNMMKVISSEWHIENMGDRGKYPTQLTGKVCKALSAALKGGE